MRKARGYFQGVFDFLEGLSNETYFPQVAPPISLDFPALIFVNRVSHSSAEAVEPVLQAFQAA
jgi:hypothetical protein